MTVRSLLVALGLTVAGGAVAGEPDGAKPRAGELSRAAVDDIISDWPAMPLEVAQKLMGKYGPPDEATESFLVWHDNGPWKRTIVHKEEVTHLFPKPHTDIVEQFVDYPVPPDKFDELARFDGSVYVDRTAGELSAKCDMEEANRLALNLAVDIVEGDRTPEEARRIYAQSIMQLLEGEPPKLTTELQFTPAARAADPDETIIPAAFLREHPTPPPTKTGIERDSER